MGSWSGCGWREIGGTAGRKGHRQCDGDRRAVVPDTNVRARNHIGSSVFFALRPGSCRRGRFGSAHRGLNMASAKRGDLPLTVFTLDKFTVSLLLFLWIDVQELCRSRRSLVLPDTVTNSCRVPLFACGIVPASLESRRIRRRFAAGYDRIASKGLISRVRCA